MIYQQPVRHKHLIAPPTLLIVGVKDHVVPPSEYANPRTPPSSATSKLCPSQPRVTYPLPKVVIPDRGKLQMWNMVDRFFAKFLPFLAT
jgi:hypothetical protein